MYHVCRCVWLVFRIPISKSNCFGKIYCSGELNLFFAQHSDGDTGWKLRAGVRFVCVFLAFTDILFCGTVAYYKGKKKRTITNNKDTASYLCFPRTWCSLHMVLLVIKPWACAWHWEQKYFSSGRNSQSLEVKHVLKRSAGWGSSWCLKTPFGIGLVLKLLFQSRTAEICSYSHLALIFSR